MDTHPKEAPAFTKLQSCHCPRDLKHSGRMGQDTQLPESGEKLEGRAAFVRVTEQQAVV